MSSLTFKSHGLLSLIYGLFFFLITLHSFYYFGVTLISLIGVTSLILVRVMFLEDYKLYPSALLAFYFFLFFQSLIGVFIFSRGFDVSRFLAFILMSILLISLCVRSRKFSIGLAIGLVLSLHITFFYVQFILYYGFGVYVEYLSLFGLESRNYSGSFVTPLGSPVLRASGLFNEPGTYSCFVAPLATIFFRYVSSPLQRLIFYGAILSLVLSMSAFGAVFFIIIISITKFKLIKVVYLSVAFSVSLPYFYWRFFLRDQSGIDTGLGFREEYIVSALKNFREPVQFFFGHGGFDVNLFKFLGVGADSDSGLIFFILYNFGALPFLFILFGMAYAFFSKSIDRVTFISLLVVLVSKISFFALALPLYLFLIFHGHQLERLKVDPRRIYNR